VLRPGAELIFSDPMQADDCPDGVLAPILERIHLQSLGSPSFYRQTAGELGFIEVHVEDQTPNLIRHYSRVLEETTRQEDELRGTISVEYLARMKQGLTRWIEGGQQGWLAWCIFCFRKA
jgi:sarcosine/dimethylglycine N-methyltransferase